MQVCIEETGGCTAFRPSSGQSVKKWNPGHYIKTQGNHADSDKRDYLQSVLGQLSKTRDSSSIRGAQIHYSWGMIEPRLGEYDWAPIYEHLSYLEGHGRKMIMVVDTKCFQSDCGSLAPRELQSDVYNNARETDTHIVETWERSVMNHYIAFWQALAAEFDGHPALEMVLASESAPSLNGGSPENFSRSAYATQLRRMYIAQGAAFRETNVVANLNFLANELSDLMEQAYQSGAGRGFPDVFDSSASLIFRGECVDQECGVRDYRGKVPHLGIVSAPTLSGKHSSQIESPSEIIAYGLQNKITHFSWVTTASGSDSWSNIIQTIESTSPNGHVACPKIYEGRCQ
jgi:hypothetical protein